MQDKLTKIFKSAKYETTTDLNEKVWNTIVIRNKRNTRIKFWAFASMEFASIAGLVPVIKMLLTDLSQSGFYEYFSLIFSDSGTIFLYWKELILSLVESLPIMSIIYTLSLLFIVFLSLRYLMKQVGKNNQLSFAS